MNRTGNFKIVVLDGFAANPGDLSWSAFAEFGEFQMYEATEKEQVAERADGANALFVGRTTLNAEILEKLGSLQFIGTLGTGYNMIDLDCCKKQGVTVCNAPGYSTMAVAQHIFALLLAVENRPEKADGAARSGFWTGIPNPKALEVYPCGLEGKTFGVVGYGSIGRQAAGIASAFGMNVTATSRSRQSGSEGNIRFGTLETVLGSADVVSLNCPLTDETRGLINEKTIGRMKDGAVLINTSRGPVVDEEALAKALNSGKLKAAAVDVLADEPEIRHSPLIVAPNCLITPHIAWTTREARQRLLDIAAENLRAFLKCCPKNKIV